MKITFPQVQSAALSDRIAQMIQDAILAGTLGPGDVLNSDALARQFNVSHIPVREALQKLEAGGIIVRSANKSARVLELTDQDITHIFQVRQELEGLAISLAAPRLDDATLRRLQALVRKMKALSKSSDFAKLFAADKEFHQIIWDQSGTPFLARLLGNLLLPYWGFLATYGYRVHQDDSDYVSRVHQGILDALASRDSHHAQQVMTDHLQRSRKVLPKLESAKSAQKIPRRRGGPDAKKSSLAKGRFRYPPASGS
jgi:DNA-binding GntR family transcriptional regulator